MYKLVYFVFLLLFPVSLAQAIPQSDPQPGRWASVGATTSSAGTGVVLSYGQSDLLGPGTDARFSLRYFSELGYGYAAPSFGLEARADALAFTYDPNPSSGLALVAYGGLGPRLLVLAGIPDYDATNYNDPAYYENPNYVVPTINAYLINLGGLGGLEARLGRFGVYLEVDASLPFLGLVGQRLQAMPFSTGTSAGLTMGVNYAF